MAEPSVDLAPLRKLLASTKIGELCAKDQRVVSLAHSYSVGDALKILARKKVLSAPLVLEPGLEDSGSGAAAAQLLGWVDISTFLHGFLRQLRAASGANPIPSRMLPLMALIEKHSAAFGASRLVTLQDANDNSLVHAAEREETDLLTAVRTLFFPAAEEAERARGVPGVAAATSDAAAGLSTTGSGESGRPGAPSASATAPSGGSPRSPVPPTVHRVAVVTPSGEIGNIISQMDVARFLLAHTADLGALASATVTELGLASRRDGAPIVSISASTPTLVAFADLSSRGLSGGPVIAPNGDLLANISISDLRSLTAEHLSVLALPVAEFLALQHGTSYLGYSVQSSELGAHSFFGSSTRAPASPRGPKGDVQLFVVPPTATFEQLLKKLVENHVHRVYVVESEGSLKIQAVISLTDVLRLAL